MLVDLASKGVTGKEAEVTLDKVGITVNKNAIPFDKQGYGYERDQVRHPTAATRGEEEDMKTIASFINGLWNPLEIKNWRKSPVR